jgi:hypothetical protein
MDDKGQVVTFRVTPKELEELDTEAKQAGLARSDYIRSRVFSPLPVPLDGNVELLLRHVIYIAVRTHSAIYSIPEQQGSLSTERLQQIYDRALTDGVKYMNELPQRIAKANGQIAGHTNGSSPGAE